MADKIAALQDKIEAEAKVFQDYQKELNKSVSTLSTLESQLTENEAVKKEFDLIKEDENVDEDAGATIYKLIGPVLVKQDKKEAVENVKRRIEYLKGEIRRVENRIKELDTKVTQKSEAIMRLQNTYQQLAQKQEEQEQQGKPIKV